MTITRTFGNILTSTYTALAIVEIVHFRDMTFDSDERVGIYLDTANAICNLGSFNIAKFPNLNGDESEVEEALALTKAESESNKMGLRILQRKNNTGDWNEIAEFILMNYGRKSYLDMRGRLGYPSKLMEKNDALAVQLVDYGDGLLWDTDFIKVDFAATIEIAKKNDVEALNARIEALELALYGRLTNLPANTLLGRNTAGVGTVEVLQQSQFLSTSGTQTLTGSIRVLKNGGDSIVDTLYFANAANVRAWNWQLTADGTAGLFGFDGATWGQKLNVGHGVITAANPPSTYGSIAFGGSKNGYAGINFPGAYGSPIFMLNSSTGTHGVWHPANVAINGWNYCYNQGDFRVYNFEAQTEGTFIGLAKGIGSLPGYPGNRYPTLKTDFGSLFFSINGGYAASINANGTYTAVSDKNRKENKEEVDYQAVLNKLKNISIYTYNFIGEDTRIRRMSCFAQDFYAVYKLGGDDEINNDDSPIMPSKMLSPSDAIGVCMASVKALTEKLDLLVAKN